ncbi:acyltransferase family protein [Rubrolithibacter danxiaensis]|uniref:acyltransferase family protein n=1 Tax=Rubrolithibacter danxiaensis TaxID=3390805 RepID=UPI003BF78BBE
MNDRVIPSLNGFRAIAILIVVVAHLNRMDNIPDSLRSFITFYFHDGKMGVRIFFVLSGFLITTLLIKEQFLKQKISLRNFYVRRSLRIIPALFIFLLFTYFFSIYYKIPITGTAFLSAFLYLTNFQFFAVPSILTHTWSLAVEEQYYLIWPVLFKKFNRILIPLTLTIICFTPFISVLAYIYPAYKNYLLAPFWGNANAIFIGSIFAILGAKNILTYNLIQANIKWIIPVCIIVFWIIEHFMYNGMYGKLLLPVGPTLGSAAMALLIFIGAHNVGNGFKFLNNAIIDYIAKISYSIYLWQQIFTQGHYNLPTNLFPYNLIFIMLFSMLSYYLVERFFLKVKSRYSIKQKTVSVVEG